MFDWEKKERAYIFHQSSKPETQTASSLDRVPKKSEEVFC
jgi:hypothetical protein